MVFQNVYLFNDTVEANIAFGCPGASHDEVVAAAKRACCHGFIEELPQGYDTVVGEGGSSLSGGQKQRISIARALLKDAPIVVLDEATASVDPENEQLIQQAIGQLTAGKTVVVIAHRLATDPRGGRRHGGAAGHARPAHGRGRHVPPLRGDPPARRGLADRERRRGRSCARGGRAHARGVLAAPPRPPRLLPLQSPAVLAGQQAGLAAEQLAETAGARVCGAHACGPREVVHRERARAVVVDVQRHGLDALAVLGRDGASRRVRRAFVRSTMSPMASNTLPS